MRHANPRSSVDMLDALMVSKRFSCVLNPVCSVSKSWPDFVVIPSNLCMFGMFLKVLYLSFKVFRYIDRMFSGVSFDAFHSRSSHAVFQQFRGQVTGFP